LSVTFVHYLNMTLTFGILLTNMIVDKLENVQRQFTNCINIISHLTYHERLSILDLESLELRRLCFDLIQYYKILNNLTPLNYAKYFTYHQPSFSSRKTSPFRMNRIKSINSHNYLSSTGAVFNQFKPHHTVRGCFQAVKITSHRVGQLSGS